MARLIFHGHACWEVQGKNHRVLFDPFLTDNPRADVGPDDFDALDAILVTHGHGDHIADVETIARRTGATIVSIVEIADYYGAKGLTAHPMNIGGKRDFLFGTVKLTIAHHSSSGPDGTPLGNATGMILTIDGKKIYHAGDTSVFLDMKLIAELGGPFDAALLPIGDNFTMGIDEGVKAAELLQARMNFPMHFNTFPVVEVDEKQFVAGVEALGLGATVLEPGEGWDIP